MSKNEKIKASFTIFALILCMASIGYFAKLREDDIDTLKQSIEKERAYLESYAKNDPSMIPTINRYLDCKDRKQNAIEGCIEHSAKTESEKIKIQQIDKHIADETEKVMKSLKTA